MIKLPKEFIEQHFNHLILKYAEKQRWYSHKSMQANALNVLEAFSLNDSNTILALMCRISYITGQEALYYIPVEVSSVPEGEFIGLFSENGSILVLRDAFLSRSYAESLMNNFTLGSKLYDGTSSLLFTRIAYFTKPENSGSRIVSTEQSNSSLIVGNSIIIKSYRNLKRGENPDIEVPVRLAELGEFKETPKPAGYVTYSGKAGKIYVAYASEFIYGSIDAWSYYNGLFGGLLSDTAPKNEYAETFQNEFLQAASSLGRLTARMHRALSHVNDPSFAPRDIEESDISGAISRIREYLETAGKLISNRNEIGHVRKTSFVRNIQTSGLETIGNRILTGIRDSHAKKIRVHGDYHLGQVLVSEGRYYVIDFEGEPLRSIEERIMQFPPVKDVAGMLRSLDYLLEFVCRGLNSGVKRKFVDELRNMSEKAFISSYRESLGDSIALLGSNEGFHELLLRLFVVEKAAYELIYELNNRPSWAWVPMKAITRMLHGIM